MDLISPTPKFNESELIDADIKVAPR